ncbi:hypothetical protein BJV82DRAFT_592855 [Fennellomyces sp. T-0311]|nr:hypothetical protein BJV82DRAFT_592855 [Fennellomyces sp. T-0311]
MSNFREASHVHYIGRYRTKFIFVGNVESDFCMLYQNPQGSYLNAMLIDATLQHLPHHHITAFNSFYLTWSTIGTCVIELEMIKSSQEGYSVAQAVLKQLPNPTNLATIETYNPSTYISKLHMLITTTNKTDGFTSAPFNNQPSPPIFSNMERSQVGLAGGHKLLKAYENVKHSGTGEVWHAFEWTNGDTIDAKSIACFADINAHPEPYVSRLRHTVFASLRFEFAFFPPPQNPTQRLLIKDMVRNVLNGLLTIDMWIFDQDEYLLATAVHFVVVSPRTKNAESHL